jgi:hypothetical protein
MMVNYWNPNRFSSILHCGLVVGPCSLWQTLLGGKNQSLTQMDARKLKAMQRQQPKREIKLRILHGKGALLLKKKQQHLDCIMYILCNSSSSVHDNA